MYWNVIKVKSVAPLALSVQFADGTFAWPGNIDLAPDAMYLAIKSSGACVLS